jgi:hypothetical protein
MATSFVVVQCGCFSRGHINIDSRIGNKVSSPWCHECSWDCVYPILVIGKMCDIFPKTPYCDQNNFML